MTEVPDPRSQQPRTADIQAALAALHDTTPPAPRRRRARPINLTTYYWQARLAGRRALRAGLPGEPRRRRWILP